MFNKLLEIKNALLEMPGIDTVKIGLESNLTADACPFIRIIAQPSRPKPDSFGITEMEIEIVYGEKVNIRTNLEETYQKIYETEKLIKDRLESIGAFWIETVPDGDTLTNLKVSSIYFKVEVSCGH